MAVALVKNEADVVEAFVRHTLAWVDHLLVLDHDSTDGTREILRALRREGLPLQLFTDDALGYLQEFRTTHLARLAAREAAADWVLPLDADEFLCGPDRAALEAELAAARPGHSRSLPLLNYLFTEADPADEANPALRLRHCQPQPSTTRKVMIPADLARSDDVVVTMGNHVLVRDGQPLPDQPLPADFYLAHLALRSAEHQVLRVVVPQLQKFSEGLAHSDIGTHNRLGFQLLAEDPDLFFAATRRPARDLPARAVPYRGGTLRYSAGRGGWQRLARALVPYLERLALSHGRLAATAGAASPESNPVIRELDDSADPGLAAPGFSGFTATAGFGPPEGPVPEAFLPVFHWGYAPATTLAIETAVAGPGRLVADLLTYSAGQTLTIALNGTILHEQGVPRINQKERLAVDLPLRPGRNELTIGYREALATERDPRRLAVIYLSLHVLQENPPAR
ncbi:MAG TPA: glycosyltransferase family 2 protein [Lacunisphaera sp.]|nr:glycosyltransferase family 2 protein [Lacunisphaera sp.]